VARLAGILLVIGSATAVAGPSGRVIRVEHAGIAAIPPRLCEIRGDGGTCVGEPPAVGQAVAVLDDHRVVAEVQIVEAAGVASNCPNLWTVKVRPLRGALPDADALGVIDPSLDLARARLLEKDHLPASPSGRASDEVWQAIDRDGDGAADIVFTHNDCDPTAGRSGSAGYCLDIWARLRGRMTRTAELNFSRCNT
jgi:hypothetical protein